MSALIALLALAAAPAAYAGPPAAAPVGRAQADGRAATLTFPGVRVTVMPFKQQTTRYQQCGVRLRERGRAEQVLTLIGAGETEALTCGGLKAFGRVLLNDRRPRIAFVYRAFSPDAAGTTAVVLVMDKRRGWRDDTGASARVAEDAEVGSIEDIRRMLKQ